MAFFSKFKLLVVVSLFFYSCTSNYYQRPESIQSKMKRYKSKKQNENIIPNYELKSIALKKRKMGRAPASSKSFYIPKNNKKFYFLSLYEQYSTMATMASDLEMKEEINHCPHFHTTLLDGKRSVQTLRPTKKKIKYDTLTNSAILDLPVQNYEKTPTVAHVINQESYTKEYPTKDHLIKKAIKLHITKTYNELKTMCETGNSNNYYHYENLLGHINRNAKVTRNPDLVLPLLMKTTLYSNIYFIKSLDKATKSSGRFPASSVEPNQNPYIFEFTKRFNVPYTVDFDL